MPLQEKPLKDTSQQETPIQSDITHISETLVDLETQIEALEDQLMPYTEESENSEGSVGRPDTPTETENRLGDIKGRLHNAVGSLHSIRERFRG